MIGQYVLKSFFRHKARTLIVILALLVVTAMLVTLNNSVDSLERQIVSLIEHIVRRKHIGDPARFIFSRLFSTTMLPWIVFII